jgi:hypothetical protein
VTIKLYEGHFHDLLNDIDKELMIADIKGWNRLAIAFRSEAGTYQSNLHGK